VTHNWNILHQFSMELVRFFGSTPISSSSHPKIIQQRKSAKYQLAFRQIYFYSTDFQIMIVIHHTHSKYYCSKHQYRSLAQEQKDTFIVVLGYYHKTSTQKMDACAESFLSKPTFQVHLQYYLGTKPNGIKSST
jgi:hypothetical protein